MFKKLRMSFAAGIVFASLFGGLIGAAVLPSGQAAACSGPVLGINPWYHGMTTGSGSTCKVISPPDTETGLTEYIWKIVLNIVDIVLKIVAYAAAIMIIYGGFLYITSNGNQDATARALKSIINASVGFIIALSSIALKNFVWDSLVAPGSNTFNLPAKSPGEILIDALNMAYFIGTVVAVIMVIIGGLNYVTSSGDSSKLTKAKNTILYAIIGLAVIIFAFAITSFINSRL